MVKKPATNRLSGSIRALGALERLSGIGRDGARVAKAIGIVDRANRRWQPPAQISFVQYIDRAMKLFGEAGTRGVRSRSPSADDLGQDVSGVRGAAERSRNLEIERNRAGRVADRRGQTSRRMRELSSAINALSRVERSAESRSPVQKIFIASRRATLTIAGKTEASSRVRESIGSVRAALAGTPTFANASSIRGVIPPAKLSRREFARPVGIIRDPDGSGASSAISINSSPTIVIHAPVANGNLQHDVIGALRAHREELFDQLKRESARRERAQF